MHPPLKALSPPYNRVIKHGLAAIFLLSIFGLGLAQAEIIKTIDENGRVTYTDNPAAKKSGRAEKVELPTINTQPPIKNTAGAPRRDNDQAAPTYVVLITAPVDQSQIPMGQHQIPVNLKLTPPLSANHRVQLYLDGQPSGAPSHGTQLLLKNINRGEHTLTAAVIDQKGKELKRSPSVLLYIQRRSVLN